MQDALTWFEIPTVDLERARGFYEHILATTLKTSTTPGDPMLLFPAPDHVVAGALVQRAQQPPSMGGTTVYLRLKGQVDEAITRVVAAGGAIIVPRTTVPGVPGSFFCVQDSEGNLVGIHGDL